MATTSEQSTFLSTGCPGLNDIMSGGYISGNSYLIRGGPGTGKTTLGLHFLQQGLTEEDDVLFISLGEPASKLKKNARHMGFDADKMHFLDLTPESEVFADNQSSSVFVDEEIDLDPLIEAITGKIEELQPARVFVDSLTQFRYLISSDYQFHKQVLSLYQYLLSQAKSVLFVSEFSPQHPDDDLQFLSDGVVTLAGTPRDRNIEISKLRGAEFRAGPHTYTIGGNGITVLPQLRPADHRRDFAHEKLSFGVPELDEMVHGGLERGCATLISGPSGVGKTTLGMQYMKEAAGRGERSVLYLFDESKRVLINRCEAIGIPIQDMLEDDSLQIIEFAPRQQSVDEFNAEIRRQVEDRQTQTIMLDSIRGFRLMTGSEHTPDAIHPLVNYVRNMGVSLLLINEVENLTGDFRISDIGISYMSDIVIFLRFIEDRGSMQKAIGVLKNRLSDYEKTLRRYQITSYGIKVGEPLHNMRGILSGTPSFVDNSEEM